MVWSTKSKFLSVIMGVSRRNFLKIAALSLAIASSPLALCNKAFAAPNTLEDSTSYYYIKDYLENLNLKDLGLNHIKNIRYLQSDYNSIENENIKLIQNGEKEQGSIFEIDIFLQAPMLADFKKKILAKDKNLLYMLWIFPLKLDNIILQNTCYCYIMRMIIAN